MTSHADRLTFPRSAEYTTWTVVEALREIIADVFDEGLGAGRRCGGRSTRREPAGVFTASPALKQHARSVKHGRRAVDPVICDSVEQHLAVPSSVAGDWLTPYRQLVEQLKADPERA
jgi:hypothetical protein